MNVGQFCQRNVVTVRELDELTTAARLMRDRHVGYLIVVEPGLREGTVRPCGVLTDRDIVVAVVAQGTDPASLRVGDVMTRNPRVIQKDDTIPEAVEQMRLIGVRRLPVVVPPGELFGVLSLDDILAGMAGELENVAGAIRSEQRLEHILRP